MIEFGMPTLIETETLEDCAQLCSSLGLSFIELNMNLPQYQLNQIKPEYFKEIAEKYHLFYTTHLDENLNVSDFNPYVAQAYLRTVKETIEIAKKLNAPVLNMHMSRGVYFTLPEKKVFLYDQYEEQYVKSMLQFRDLCESEIGDSDIRICIENSDGFTAFHQKVLPLLLQSPVIKLTFDIGHNHSIDGKDEPIIMQYEDHFIHMHMHDALGNKNHLALGTGELDLNYYLALSRKHNSRIVLETKTVEGLKQSVDWIHNNYKE